MKYICAVPNWVYYLIRSFRGVMGGLKYFKNKVVYSILFITLAFNMYADIDINTFLPIGGSAASVTSIGFFIP